MMLRETGEKTFPIWLLGDSNPIRWQDSLETPLDVKHPVRHNIWTSILDVVQETVYQDSGIRLRTDTIYTRNAVQSPEDKPTNKEREWHLQTMCELDKLKNLILTNEPIILITFGAFSFEFVRRATNEPQQFPYTHWDTKNLGRAFCDARDAFKPSAINVLPLLHRSISGGYFLKSHANFTQGECCGNYFTFAGRTIASILLKHFKSKDVWLKGPRIPA